MIISVDQLQLYASKYLVNPRKSCPSLGLAAEFSAFL